MTLPPRPVLRAFVVAFVATLVLDQLTKIWILMDIMAIPQVIEITSFFNLVLVWNTGVSFGLFGGGTDVMRWILIGLALVIVGFLLHWLRTSDRPFMGITLGLVAGGAIGNVIDRILHGAVVDFLDFHVAGFHWPAFNIADSGITIGVVLLIGDSLFNANQTRTQDREE